jgi:hypothetical protein
LIGEYSISFVGLTELSLAVFGRGALPVFLLLGSGGATVNLFFGLVFDPALNTIFDLLSKSLSVFEISLLYSKVKSFTSSTISLSIVFFLN